MESIRFFDNAIYFEERSILAVSDLHLGRRIRTRTGEKSVNPQIEEHLKKVVNQFEPETIVFNGDTFNHRIPVTESIETIESVLNERPEMKSVFIVGNHDKNEEDLEESIEEADAVHTEYEIGDIVFAHGHMPIESEGEVYVIGHLHPSMTNGNSRTQAYMKSQTGDGRDVLAIPSPHPGVTRTDLLTVDIEQVCPILEECDNHFISRTGDDWSELG